MERVTMRTKLIITTLSMQVFGASLLAATVYSEIRNHYPQTTVSADGQVANVGTVLTVQAAEIYAIPTGKFVSTNNDTTDGHFSHSRMAKFALQSSGARPLEINEKAYLVGIRLKESKKDSSVVLTLQTCGTCDPAAPDPNHVPHRATVSFDFPKGTLDGANAD